MVRANSCSGESVFSSFCEIPSFLKALAFDTEALSRLFMPVFIASMSAPFISMM